MNNKDSKVPILIVIVVAVILIAAGGYYILGGKITPGKNGAVNGTTPVPTAKVTTPVAAGTPGTPAPAGTSAVVTAPAKVDTIKCELCHTDPQNLPPHVNGGKLCVTCHGSQVHNIHIGPGTVGLDCNTCHGSPPKIPVVDKSADGPGHYSVCENCHAPPPEPLKPSFGNLITVHLSRAKYCTNCHGTDIGVIHAAALANATK
ncbi:MAG: hypothetical protein WA130_05710 [Candidatus Methanoperedens sp.]